MPPKGKKNNNKNASSPANVTGGESSSMASSSTTFRPNPSVAPPLAPIFTSSSPNRGRSPSKRPRANTSSTPPPPTNTMESLVSAMVFLTGVQNEQATTIKSFDKIIAEVHKFKTECSPHIIALMKEMNAFQATITSLTASVAALETAPSPPSPQPLDTTAGPSDQLLALAARIDAMETAPAPPPPPLPPPPRFPSALPTPPSPSLSYAQVASKAAKKRQNPKTKTEETLVNMETTKLQRQLVVTCDPTPPTTISNNAILASVNKALETTGV
ncbi:hypothetical protein Q9L58_010653 [Maublancomyces gigas]|uniref:Uncharacterized protein n=1 Tax=Discina gigas TaxID=1032678 RepID=A0ABR3G3I9_9PEZI